MLGLATFQLILFGTSLVTLIIYLLFHRVAHKNLFKTLKSYNSYKYGFYECGFKPKYELTVNFTLQTYVLFSLVLLYDIEGFFLILFFLSLDTLCGFDLFLIGIYICFFFIGFWFEATTHGADWMLY